MDNAVLILEVHLQAIKYLKTNWNAIPERKDL